MRRKPRWMRDRGEKKPWDFHEAFGEPQQDANLRKFGIDYTLWGYVKLIGVERKSWGNYLMNITTSSAMDDLKRTQLTKLQRINRRGGHTIVVVEGCIGDFSRYSKTSLDQQVLRTAALVAEFGVPILFFRDRNLALQGARHFMLRARKEIEGR